MHIKSKTALKNEADKCKEDKIWHGCFPQGLSYLTCIVSIRVVHFTLIYGLAFKADTRSADIATTIWGPSWHCATWWHCHARTWVFCEGHTDETWNFVRSIVILFLMLHWFIKFNEGWELMNYSMKPWIGLKIGGKLQIILAFLWEGLNDMMRQYWWMLGSNLCSLPAGIRSYFSLVSQR